MFKDRLTFKPNVMMNIFLSGLNSGFPLKFHLHFPFIMANYPRFVSSAIDMATLRYWATFARQTQILSPLIHITTTVLL